MRTYTYEFKTQFNDRAFIKKKNSPQVGSISPQFLSKTILEIVLTLHLFMEDTNINHLTSSHMSLLLSTYLATLQP